MSASVLVKAAKRNAWRSALARRAPAVVAVVLVLLGVIAVAVRLDAPSDGTVVSFYRTDGVVVDISSPLDGPGLQTGDVVIEIAGHRLADGLGGLTRPQLGEEIAYDIVRDGTTRVTVRVDRTDPYPLLLAGWGNLIFVFALAALATALFLRRPEEPSTTPLLIGAAGLLGSTLAYVAGIPALALGTGGPVLWLYNLCVVGVYSLAWGAGLAFALQLPQDDRGLRPRRAVLALAYGAPLALMLVWMAAVAVFAPNALRWFDLVYAGTTGLVAATLVTVGVLAMLAYRRSRDPLTRSRLRWVAGGGIMAGLFGLAGWHLPELITGHPLLPSGAIGGLSALPFVVGIAVALRRHRLFDIERLANRSLVYVSLVAVLVAGYAALVAVLVSGLRLSGTVAAAIAAAAAALALAPVRNVAQRTVNRLMYGDRDDPPAVLARLGTRMQAVMLPGEVLPVVVETVAHSLRLPYVAIDLTDGTGEFALAAEHGVPEGRVHSETLTHHGETVGRLRVSERGRDDPLEAADLELIRSLAREVGPAVQAVRLHEDLLRSRAEVVALREDERRRLRRDLHDGLGPTLAAIRLKAGLAARQVPPESAARGLLGEIDTEVTTSLADIRRLVEALRPPALDELGLLGAVRSRAAALAGEMEIDVGGSHPPGPLPAAIETAAYRIAVEAMTNAVRHSDGTRCTVSILVADEVVELAVRDDGHGLKPDRTPGVGLRSMRERAAEVGGTLTVGLPAEGGTVITARLPLSLGGPVDQADRR